jgi:hypothetical protein
VIGVKTADHGFYNGARQVTEAAANGSVLPR